MRKRTKVKFRCPSRAGGPRPTMYGPRHYDHRSRTQLESVLPSCDHCPVNAVVGQSDLPCSSSPPSPPSSQFTRSPTFRSLSLLLLLIFSSLCVLAPVIAIRDHLHSTTASSSSSSSFSPPLSTPSTLTSSDKLSSSQSSLPSTPSMPHLYSSSPSSSLIIESFGQSASEASVSNFKSSSPQPPSTVNIPPDHSNANVQSSTTTSGHQRHTSHDHLADPISRHSSVSTPLSSHSSSAPSAHSLPVTTLTGGKSSSLPNHRESRRESKLDEPQTQAPVAESRQDQSQPPPPLMVPGLAKAKNSPNGPPSSMDDIIGGLLQLMGGNMKIPPGSGQAGAVPSSGGSASEKLSHLLANLGGGHKRHQHNNNNNGNLPQQRPPPIPPFGSLPNLNLAHLQQQQQGRPGMPQNQFLPPGNQFPMYQNFPFIPLMSGGSGGRPAIPIGGAGGGPVMPKLPPNFPPLNGLTKNEMDALYAQFVASGGGGGGGPDKSNLIANLMKLTGNQPLPPGLQLPPGVLMPSKPSMPHPTSKTYEPNDGLMEISSSNVHSNSHSMLSPSPSFDTMHPMTATLLPNRLPPSVSGSDEPPQIITMAEEPSIFEMVVKHKIGPSVSVASSSIVTPTPTLIKPSRTLDPNRPTVNFATSGNDVVVQEIRNQHGQHVAAKESSPVTSRTKDDIVYGKRIPKPSQTSGGGVGTATLPSSIGSNAASMMASVAKVAPSRTQTLDQHRHTATPKLVSSSTMVGKPLVLPVDVDDGVRPKVGAARPSPTPTIHPTSPAIVEPTRTNDGTLNRNGATGGLSKPVSQHHQTGASKPSTGIGSVVSEPQSSKGSKPSLSSQSSSSSSNGSPSARPHVRRPPFRPRPNVPIVRIDTCIVGDDTTCDVSLHEKCITELGLSSCQCRPGFARLTSRTACVPVLALSLVFRVDRMNGNKVQFTRPLLNPNSEEYQYLEYECLLAMNSMFATTKLLAAELMGVKVNRFYSIGGKTLVNATVNLRADANETTGVGGANAIGTPSVIKRTVQQELLSAIAATNNQLGDSQLWVDSAATAVTRVDDLNECSTADTNDCSKHARCVNEFGTFRCECEPGYDDKHAGERHKSGRQCTSCPGSYCSNRGECMISRGERVCKCRANFIGAQCDIDVEVLGVAIGGSIAALIIIVITFICLYMWNQRFKQEQQKIEAMSATSGHTFSYVNKHGPPTMSRMSIDERYGRSWATHYSDSQQHLLAGGGSSGSGSNNTNYYGMNTSPDHNHHHHHHHQSSQPVYATPVRVVGTSSAAAATAAVPDYDNHQIPYPDYGGSTPVTRNTGHRSLKVRSTVGTTRQANLTNSHHGLHYPSYAMKLTPPDSYNETEFSTRELIYSPAHLYATNPRTNHGFYS